MVEVESGGQARWYSTLARPEVRPGDRVITHANLVLSILTEAEAAEMEAAVAELLVPPPHPGSRTQGAG